MDRDVLRTYEIPERGDAGRASFLVEPDTPGEVSAVASWAYRQSARMVIQGANTGLVGASTPDASGLQGILGLNRLDRIVDVSVADRIAVVEAGVRLDFLNESLASHGLFFPVEVGSNPSIGGLIATNAGGARTIRHGDTRSNVLGVEAVIADEPGTTIAQLSPLRKDNSSLRLDRMFIGSYGALGVVTRASLGLLRRPTSVVAVLLAITSHGGAFECLLELEKAFPQSMAAFEFIDGETMRIVLDNMDRIPSPFPELSHSCYALAEVSGESDISELQDEVAAVLDRLSTTGKPAPLADAIFAPPRDLWSLRHSMSEGVRAEGKSFRFDVSMPRTSLPVLRERLEGALGDTQPRPVISQFGHWGDGGTHLQLLFREGQRAPDTDELREKVYAIVVGELGGSFSAEHGLGRYNAEYYRRYVSEDTQRMERLVKDLFDPRRVWGSEPYR